MNILLSISFNICSGAQKNRLSKTVYLSNHNICFRSEIRKILFNYKLLTRGMIRTWMYPVLKTV